MTNEIDLTLSEHYDITVEKNRTLDIQLQSEVYSGNTYIGLFDFSPYTSAILEVRTKPNDFNLVTTFKTNDGSIVLQSNGLFKLVKSATALNLRSGVYYYDMYLTSVAYPKRGFLKGKFTIEETTTK